MSGCQRCHLHGLVELFSFLGGGTSSCDDGATGGGGGSGNDGDGNGLLT